MIVRYGILMTKSPRIPKATIKRLSLYSRQLELLEFDGYRMVSSEKMAWLCQVNPTLVRKDLGYFGEFGVRGVGYNVRDLLNQIKRILAVNRTWNVGLIGIGHLGMALLRRREFPARGYNLVSVFDSDPHKIGTILASGLRVNDIKDLEKTVQEMKIGIGIIATPDDQAQTVADRLIDCGVRAILNVSKSDIPSPQGCMVENVDFSIRLGVLTYRLKDELGL